MEKDHIKYIRKGFHSFQKYMKNNKISLTSTDEWDQTILHMVAYEGDYATLNWVLKQVKPSELKKRDKNGWTPLHASASQGKLDMYELLLRKGASPNAQNGDLTSPFAYLCR